MLEDKIIQLVADSKGTLKYGLAESGDVYWYEEINKVWVKLVVSPTLHC